MDVAAHCGLAAENFVNLLPVDVLGVG